MTNVVAMVAALLMWTTMVAVAAQTASQPQTDQGQARLEQIKERLELTPEQVEQLRPILMDEMKKVREEWRQQLRDRAGNPRPQSFLKATIGSTLVARRAGM